MTDSDHDDRPLNIDELATQIQDDIKYYNSNYNQIRREVLNVVTDNKRLSQQIHELQSQDISNYSRDEHDRLAKDAIDNLKHQVALLQDEKQTFQCLWKISEETIRNLENEVCEYRKQLNQPDTSAAIRSQFTVVVKMLEATLEKLKTELKCEKESNRSLTEAKFMAEQKYNDIECKYKELLATHTNTLDSIKQMEISMNATKSQIRETIREKTDLEKQLSIVNGNIRELIERERQAFVQLQNALSVAENALAEKTEAIEREKGIKDECDYLTKTIGEVMEEAAARVDKDVAALKKQYNDKIRTLESVISQLKTSLAAEQKKGICLEQRAHSLEDNLRATIQKNCTLDTDLQIASRTIVEMELKLDAFEKLLVREQETYKICDKNTQEIKDFLISSRQIKAKWKETIEDVTEKLRLEIRHLLNQNAILVNENRALQSRAMQQS